MPPQANRYPPQQQGYGPADGAGQPHHAPVYQQPAAAAPQGYYPAPPQTSYQPVFDRYAAAPDPGQRSFDPRSVNGRAPQHQPAQAYAAPQAYAPPQPSLYDTHVARQGGAYEQWPQPPQSAAPQQQSQVPRGYDFSNYMPAAAQPQEYAPGAAQPQYQTRQPTLQPQTRHDDAQWQLGGAYDRPEDAAAEASAYGAPQTNYPAEPSGELQPADEEAYDPDDLGEYEDEEPRKSRRGLVMISALVGAIALGGGMAYGYKTFIKPPAGNAQVAKVAAPTGPAKTQPAEAGGKQFPNQNSKLQERLGEGSPPAGTPPATVASMTPASSAGGAPDLEGGVKRVPTVVVGRDGSMTAPAGMVVVGAAQPQASRPAAQPPAADVPAAAPLTAPASPQARVAAAVPPSKPAVPVVANAAPAEAAPGPAPKKATPKKAAAARDDAAAPAGGAAPAVAAKSGATGYVAVIASKNNRADAQKANAELEQKFEVLKGKVFDVQEADLSAQGKGVVYRSVVGPPGSRAFASSVCSELKAAGYNDCWPVAYSQ
jgi:hypothetical protein